MWQLLITLSRSTLAVAICLAMTAPVSAQALRVTVENLSPTGGIFLTPVWIGFHDGGFDTYDQGAPASAGLEQIAEDGDFSTLSSEFQAAAPSGQDGAVFGGAGAGGPVDPGETASLDIAVGSANRYFSYASMVIPSNDAFIANGNPQAHEIFDAAGNFLGPLEFLVLGSEVLDAGTEDNTEMEAAFLNQTGPNSGDTTAGGTVALHPGFIGSAGNPGGTPIILSGSAVNAANVAIDPTAADFTLGGYQVARIRIAEIPEPTSLALASAALLAVHSMAVRRRK